MNLLLYFGDRAHAAAMYLPCYQLVLEVQQKLWKPCGRHR